MVRGRPGVVTCITHHEHRVSRIRHIWNDLKLVEEQQRLSFKPLVANSARRRYSDTESKAGTKRKSEQRRGSWGFMCTSAGTNRGIEVGMGCGCNINQNLDLRASMVMDIVPYIVVELSQHDPS